MSTYWGYVCKSHDPNLRSERWFNHGEDTLTDAFRKERAGQWPMDGTHPLLEEPVHVFHGDTGSAYGTRAPIYWLRDHPRCVVWLENEYGDTRPMEERP